MERPLIVKIEQYGFEDSLYPVTLMPTARYAAAVLVPTGSADIEPVDPAHGLWQVNVPPNLFLAADQGLDLRIDAMGYVLTIDLDPR